MLFFIYIRSIDFQIKTVINRLNFLKLSVVFVLSICAMSCTLIDKKPAKAPEKQWVFVELMTKSKNDTTDYFYFGQIKKSVLSDIETKNQEGLFTLSDVRYWNTDDLIEMYEDDKRQGDLVFRIGDVVKITHYNDDPIDLYEDEELHKTAKRYKLKRDNNTSKEE